MMGAHGGKTDDIQDDGLTPRICKTIFSRIEERTTKDVQFDCEVSYYEIYNEKVKDLLNVNVTQTKHNLKVREHKVMGPYVEGLQKLAVTGFDQILMLMTKGNKQLTTAATAMNDTSRYPTPFGQPLPSVPCHAPYPACRPACPPTVP